MRISFLLRAAMQLIRRLRGRWTRTDPRLRAITLDRFLKTSQFLHPTRSVSFLITLPSPLQTKIKSSRLLKIRLDWFLRRHSKIIRDLYCSNQGVRVLRRLVVSVLRSPLWMTTSLSWPEDSQHRRIMLQQITTSKVLQSRSKALRRHPSRTLSRHPMGGRGCIQGAKLNRQGRARKYLIEGGLQCPKPASSGA